MITLDQVNDDVRAMLLRAQDEARALGHGYIGTEHLLIACVAAGGSRAAGELAGAGVDVATLRTAIHREFVANGWTPYVGDDELLATIGVDLAAIRAEVEAEFGAGALPMRVGAPAFTARVGRLLGDAVERAAGERATVDHVVIAILADGESVATKVLAAVGVDIERVLRG